jgi:hypothetical protein
MQDFVKLHAADMFKGARSRCLIHARECPTTVSRDSLLSGFMGQALLLSSFALHKALLHQAAVVSYLPQGTWDQLQSIALLM